MSTDEELAPRDIGDKGSYNLEMMAMEIST